MPQDFREGVRPVLGWYDHHTGLSWTEIVPDDPREAAPLAFTGDEIDALLGAGGTV